LSSRKRTKRLPGKMTIDPMVRAKAELLTEVIDRGLFALVERRLGEEIVGKKMSARDKS
jgi:hypothetical protein